MKTVVVTGASSGIGNAIAKTLATQGAKVILVNRISSKLDNIVEEIKNESNNPNIFLETCDLSDLHQVKKIASILAKKYHDIDVLINNAGLELTNRTLTSNGFEMTFAVNYLAPFLLTNELIKKLPKTKQFRVINTTSLVEKWGKIDFENLQSEKYYNSEKTYYNSKLALLLFTYQLARRFDTKFLTSNCYEPGLTKTSFTRDFKGFAKIMSKIMSLFMKSPQEAAKTPIYLAMSDEIKDTTGKCFSNMKVKKTSPISYDHSLARKLWDKTEGLLKIYLS